MKVQSSTISEINYDGKLLTVTFNDGMEYVYEGVPAKIYEEIIQESGGKKLFTNDEKCVIMIK